MGDGVYLRKIGSSYIKKTIIQYRGLIYIKLTPIASGPFNLKISYQPVMSV